MIINVNLLPDPHTGEDVYMRLRHGIPGARYIEISGESQPARVGDTIMTAAPMAEG